MVLNKRPVRSMSLLMKEGVSYPYWINQRVLLGLTKRYSTLRIKSGGVSHYVGERGKVSHIVC